MSSSAPRQFGKYELLHEIGRGGMGVVFKARQIDLDRPVAIKMILAQYLSSPGHIERLAAEAQAAARVSHPNVVGVIETGSHNGQHFIAMEYVPGSSLGQVLAEGATDLQTVLRLLVDVAAAVDYLHQQGILHLDLKPSNILVAEDGRAVVTDFGLARVLVGGDAGDDGAVVGTPGYIAPELLLGRAGVANRLCDVYSLGAVLYEVVTGQAPFGDATPMSRLLHAIEQDPQPPRALAPKTPRALETIILKSMDRDHGRRYQSAGALGRDLERWLSGEPIEAVPAMGWCRLRRWVRRYPALASRLMILVAFVSLLLANLVFGLVSLEFFVTVAVWLGLWGLVCLACEFLPDRRHPGVAFRYLWSCADAALLTVVLFEADGVRSSLTLVYPLMVLNAGFWVRVRLVVWVTALALLSYGLIWVDSAFWRQDGDVGPDRHLLFVIVVVLTGILAGMQVRRLRSITAYYASRRR